MSPEGVAILQTPVRKLFPTDDSEAEFESGPKVPLSDLIQEALQQHSSGIFFRERGAGPGLDRDMTHEGFQVEIYIDWTTGFVVGGNQNNCGTWMDKVGESNSAGNRGVPATPR